MSIAAVRVCVLSIAVFCGVAQSATIYVNTAGDDAADGQTWATARKTVQAGLNTAQPGDEVWVAAGTYDGTVTLKAGVALYGGFAGTETDLASRDWKTNEAILNGTQDDSVVASPQGATASTRIDGFTIQGGKGRLIGGSRCGGGIYCYNSSPTIANNKIIGNTGDNGGGLCCGACSPLITNNTISGNNAVSQGSGIYCWYASPTIENNTIANNGQEAGNDGGAIYCYGDSSAKIVNNTIKGNKASRYGGGIECENSASPIIANNTITNNSAGSGGGICCVFGSPTVTSNTITGNSAGLGGGIYCDYFSPTVASNMISGNSASFGGGIYCNYSSPTIASNAISGNEARLAGGIYCYGGSSTIRNNAITANGSDWGDGGGICCNGETTITNTIVAFNSSGILGSARSIGYTCVYGNTAYNFAGFPDPTGSTGNISVDPLLVRLPSSGPDGTWGTADDDYGDLHLLPGSPCINAGDPAYVPAEGETDMDGRNRMMGTAVDMGAYESGLAGDVNGDGYVNVGDLQALVAAWGSSSSTGETWNANADLTNDGYINVGDLQILVADWGKRADDAGGNRIRS